MTDQLTIEAITIDENNLAHIGELGIIVGKNEKMCNLTLGANTSRLFATDWGAMRRFEEPNGPVLARQDIIYKPLAWMEPGLCDERDQFDGSKRPWKAMQWVLKWYVCEYKVSVVVGIPRTEVLSKPSNFDSAKDNRSMYITFPDEKEDFAFDSQKLWLDELQKGSQTRDVNLLAEAMQDQVFSDTIDSDLEPGAPASAWTRLNLMANDMALALTHA